MREFRLLAAIVATTASAVATTTPTPPFPACENGYVCPNATGPVCGSDGLTYATDCALTIARCEDPSLALVSDGACPSPTPTSACELGRTCSPGDEPVCGSDGVTYDNQCVFQVAKCKDPTLEIVMDGSCYVPMPVRPMPVPLPDTECRSGYVCQAARDPVCGSDGKTYNNKCEMTVAQCTDASLIIAGGGPCTAGTFDCSASCQTSQDLVCGSDGKTYDNQCFFQRAKFCSPGDASIVIFSEGSCTSSSNYNNNNKGETPLDSTMNNGVTTTQTQTSSPRSPSSQSSLPASQASSGATTPEPSSCDEIDCTSDKSPVCGSDGNTYINKCQLKRAQCSDSKLTLVATDSCSSIASVSSVGKEADDGDFHGSSSSASLELLSSSSSSSSLLLSSSASSGISSTSSRGIASASSSGSGASSSTDKVSPSLTGTSPSSSISSSSSTSSASKSPSVAHAGVSKLLLGVLVLFLL